MMTLCGRSVRVKVDFQSLHFTSTRNVHYRHDFDASFSNNVKCTAAESIDFSAHEYYSIWRTYNTYNVQRKSFYSNAHSPMSIVIFKTIKKKNEEKKLFFKTKNME